MKTIEAPTKVKTEEEIEAEQEAERIQEEERELFEKYDYPIFLEELAEYAEVEESDILLALHYLFFHGWQTFLSVYDYGTFRGKYPLEIAMIIYSQMENGKVNKSRLGNGFKSIVTEAKRLVEQTNGE